MKIITASERMSQRGGIKAVILGKSGIGKTTLLKTLPQSETLFFDLEAGDLAVEGWTGDAIQPRTWDECRNLAVCLAGPDPSKRAEQTYSQAHYDFAMSQVDGADLSKYSTVFVDSITVAGRLCFQWAQGQPESFSEKTGKPDTRGAYGLHGREMLAWLSCLQQARNLNVVFVGILDEKKDDYGRTEWSPQIEGSKVGRELPGIVDQVISYMELATDEGAKYRGLVCTSPNAWGVPAKDRSGRLNQIEEPHLGKLFQKIRNGVRHDTITTSIPDHQAA